MVYQCRLVIGKKYEGLLRQLVLVPYSISGRSDDGCVIVLLPNSYFKETVFKEKHGVWDLMPVLTITLSHSQLRSQLSTPTTKGKGWSGDWLSTFASAY